MLWVAAASRKLADAGIEYPHRVAAPRSERPPAASRNYVQMAGNPEVIQLGRKVATRGSDARVVLLIQRLPIRLSDR